MPNHIVISLSPAGCPCWIASEDEMPHPGCICTNQDRLVGYVIANTLLDATGSYDFHETVFIPAVQTFVAEGGDARNLRADFALRLYTINTISGRLDTTACHEILHAVLNPFANITLTGEGLE